MTRKFLKPTKVTWITFILFITILIALPFLYVIVWQITDGGGESLDVLLEVLFIPLIAIPVGMVIGLFVMLSYLVDLEATSAEFGPGAPNIIGFLVIIVNIAISLAILYVFASLVSCWHYSRRTRKG